MSGRPFPFELRSVNDLVDASIGHRGPGRQVGRVSLLIALGEYLMPHLLLLTRASSMSFI